MALLLVMALAGCSQTQQIDNDALEATVPASWRVADSVLTPNLGSPHEILTVGTFDLRPGGDTCAHVPETALEDLGPTDVLISLQEAINLGPNMIVRPASFEPLLTGVSNGDALECVEQGQRADIGVLVWQPFQDQGRSFYLLVAMGTDVDEGTRAAAVEFLDGISFGR